MVINRARPAWAGLGIAIIVTISSTVTLLFFRAVFAGSIIVSPTAFWIFGIGVHWYGLLAALGILIGFPWALRRAKSRELKPARLVEETLWWAIGGGLVGARLVYVLQNIPVYIKQPLQILAVADGGLSIHGMLLGGLISGAMAAKVSRINFWKLADAALPPLLLGMILGRFGNFANGELFGYPTSLPWKMFVVPTNRPEAYLDQSFFHPIFLYDAMLNSLLLVFLLRTQQGCRFNGELLGRMLLGISVTRFIVEWWRINDPPTVGMLSTAQIVSLVLGLVSLMFILIGRRRPALSN
jgi:phosphatidylglycerol:prolipoprotein diacylglycerol transferase